MKEVPEALRITRLTLQATYPLGFMDDPMGINTASSDPQRLKRLRIHPSLSGKQLVQHLHVAMTPPSEMHAGNPEKTTSADWISLEGQVRAEAQTVMLEGSPRAEIVLAQSHSTENWVLETDLKIDGGQFWLMQTSPDTLEKWRIGGDGTALHLQKYSSEGVMETLAHIPFPNKYEKTWHHIRLIKRAQGLWIEWDGKPLRENRPYYLSVPWRSPLHWVTWSQGSNSRLHLKNHAFATFLPSTQFIEGRPTAKTIQNLIRDSKNMGRLLPSWIEVQGEQMHTLPMDQDLFLILSRQHGWDIVPVVRIKSVSSAQKETESKHRNATSSQTLLLNNILHSLMETPWKELYFDLSELDPSQQNDWVETLKTLQKNRKEKDPHVLITSSATSLTLTLPRS